LFEPERIDFIIDGVSMLPPLGFDVPVDVIMKKIK
jgi:hypothetical protein